MTKKKVINTFHWVNRTQGAGCVASGHIPVTQQFRWCRIKSTHCEQKQWDRILWAVPEELYLNVASGHHVVVHDLSTKKDREPRSLWQGVQFIYCVMLWHWYGIHHWQPIVRGRGGTSMQQYFHHVYSNLSKSTRSRLSSFREFLPPDFGWPLLEGCHEWERKRQHTTARSAFTVGQSI